MTLVYLGVGWLAGLVLAGACPLKWPVWSLLGLLPMTAAVLQRHNRRQWRIHLALAFLFLGAARYRGRQPRFGPGDLAAYNGQGWGLFEGFVSDEPDPRADSTNLTVTVGWMHLEGDEPRQVDGRALLRAPRYPAFRYGDRLRFSGRLETPPEGERYSYRDDLARERVYSLVRRPLVEPLAGYSGSLFKRLLFDGKARVQQEIQRMLPDPEASLLSGILLGNEQGIPAALKDDFNATGTTHVIAISGFNISIVTLLVFTWLGRAIPRRYAGALTIVVIAAYTLFVGAEAAVVRAAVMGSLLVAGCLLGRQTFGPASLMAAAVGMTAVEPLLIGDPGFQLSFAATLGMMVYAAPLQRAALRGLARFMKPGAAARLARLLGDSLLVTCAAQITTLPLVAYLFGRASPVSLFSNLLILLAQPPLMVLGVLAAAIGLLWPFSGGIVGWTSYLFLWWTIRVVEATARFPHACIEVQLPLAGMLAIYGLILGVTWWALRPGRVGRWWEGLTAQMGLKGSLAAAVAALALAAGVISNRPDGRLHVTVLDVGEGEATLVQTPTGRRVLVDGGRDPAVVLSHLGRRSAFWDRSLALIVATHPDSDHVNGLSAVLERYRVGALITNGETEGPPAWNEMIKVAEEQGTQLVTAVRGQIIDTGDGVLLEVLHPGDRLSDSTDNNSVVIQLRYGDFSFLLTGDVGAEAEQRLLDAGNSLSSIVLQAADGGDRDGSSLPFLKAVNPWMVVLSVGENNPYRHPAPQVLERIEMMGCAIGRTDELGNIHFVTDGERLWVNGER